MTEPRILADRLVERVFGKKPKVFQKPPSEELSAPHSVNAMLEDSRNRRIERQRLLSQFKEF